MQERRRGVNPLPVDDNVAKARMFHLAQGVLVGLRRRPPEEVLSELIDVAQRFGLSPFALARALVRRPDVLLLDEPPPAAGRPRAPTPTPTQQPRYVNAGAICWNRLRPNNIDRRASTTQASCRGASVPGA